MQILKQRSPVNFGRILLTAFILGSLLAIVTINASKANDPKSEEEVNDLKRYISESLADWDIPGMAVAVIYNDKVVLAEGFGQKQIGHSDKIDAESLFQIGSTSKAFAAAAIAALVDDGEIDWDTRVIDILPWFNTPDKTVTEQTTVRELLAHYSGIGGEIGASILVMDPETAAKRLEMPGTTRCERGTFCYSNSGYGLTELVIEAVTGSSWKTHVEERIFAPLKMHDSATTPYDIWSRRYIAPTFLGSAPVGTVDLHDAEPATNVSMPHGYDRNGNRRRLSWQSYDSLAPAGNIVSNARDMAQWLRLWLNEGLVDGEQILSKATVREMITPQVEEERSYFLYSDNPQPVSYSLGWSVDSLQGRRIVFHGGGIFGFPAFVAFFPDDGLGVAVMANGSTYSPYYPHQAVVAKVAAEYLGLEPRDWHSEALDGISEYGAPRKANLLAEEADRNSDLLPSLPLSAFVGKYKSVDEGKRLGAAFVVEKNGGLFFQFSKPGELSGPLTHWQGDEFKLFYLGGDGVAWSNLKANFTMGNDKVNRLNIEMLGSFEKIE